MGQKDCSMSLIQKPCPREVFDCRRCMTKMKNTGRVWQVSTGFYLISTPLYAIPFSRKLIWDIPANVGRSLQAWPDGTRTCSSGLNGTYHLPANEPGPVNEAYLDKGTLIFDGETSSPPDNVTIETQIGLTLYYLEVWRLHLTYFWIDVGGIFGAKGAFLQSDGDYISTENDCKFTNAVDFLLDLEDFAASAGVPDSSRPDLPASMTVQLVDINS